MLYQVALPITRGTGGGAIGDIERTAAFHHCCKAIGLRVRAKPLTIKGTAGDKYVARRQSNRQPIASDCGNAGDGRAGDEMELPSSLRIERMDVAARRRQKLAANHCQIVHTLKGEARLRVVQHPIGPQRAVERRHGDGGVAPTEKIVDCPSKSGDHDPLQ